MITKTLKPMMPGRRVGINLEEQPLIMASSSNAENRLSGANGIGQAGKCGIGRLLTYLPF